MIVLLARTSLLFLLLRHCSYQHLIYFLLQWSQDMDKSFFEVPDKKVESPCKNVNLIILAIETLVENCDANHFTLLPYDQMK